MKRFNAIELVILIFAVSIGLVIVSTIAGMLFGGATTTANEAIRLAVIDLIKYITAGVFGAIAALKSIDKP